MSWPAVLAAQLTSGCVMPAIEPRAVLDTDSGTSLTVVDQPLVLARERRDVAVRARDYLTLVAAEINDAGHRRLVWVAHQWSTIDARAADLRPTPGTPLLLVADGRDLRLNPIHEPAPAYLRNPAFLTPEDAHVLTTVYAVDAATLEFVAESRQISASLPESRLVLPFSTWTDGRAALRRLLERIAR